MSYQIELRHFKYFMAVATELHFRRASEKLFISQPGLSRQIKEMEETLGVELFSRNKRKVELTPAGHYLKSEMEFIFNHIEMIKKQLTMIDKGMDGEIRVGFLGSAMHDVIPKLLVRMSKEYPLIKSNLEEMSNYDQVNAIEKNELDIGFVRLARVPHGLKIRTVYEDNFSLVLPVDHKLSEENFEGVHQVREENFILFSREYSLMYYDNIMSIFEDKGFTPKVSHRSVHAHTIFRLVENGLGIAVIPSSLKDGFDLNVKFIEIPDIPQKAILSAVWREDNRNPILQNVLRILFEL